MEDKWDVYCYNDVFYFCSSWHNDLVFKVGLTRMKQEHLMRVSWIEFSQSHHMAEAEIIDRQVDFLIKVLLGFHVPAPAPSNIKALVEEYCRYAGSIYGRIVEFATDEDTTHLTVMRNGQLSLKTPPRIIMKKDWRRK